MRSSVTISTNLKLQPFKNITKYITKSISNANKGKDS